jgi:hypothetical protein
MHIFRHIFLSNYWWQIYKSMLNLYTNQQNRQTGSRNLMGPKTLPTIWGTYMKLVTKYQISAINSGWEKWDEKWAYTKCMFNVYKNQQSLFADLVGFYTHWTCMHIFRHIFLSNYWWQKSDIWSQASYRYPISLEAFLDPSDSYFLFAYFVDFYTHWTYILYMPIFSRIFLSNYWWQKSDIWSQASYRYAISWEAFGPIRFLLPVCRFCWFLYTFNIHLYMHIFLCRQTGSRNLTGPKTLPTIWHTYMKLVTKYQIPVVNSCLEKCDEKCAYTNVC